MLGINKFKHSVVTYPWSLKNLEGKVVYFTKGERVNLLSLTSGLFAIQNEAKGTAVLPQGLFANNFKLFEKGV